MLTRWHYCFVCFALLGLSYPWVLLISVQLLKRKPCLMYLMRATSQVPVTMRKLLLILNPNFAVPGSNRRRQEDISYGMFINYLREVAGKCTL